jgi:hypothetical protein
MRIIRLSAALLLAASLVSCATAQAPVSGLWYTSAKGPTTVGNDTAGAKNGKACATSILGIIASGDASIASAAKAGGITKVGYVDYSAFSILGLYAEFCTLVRGG